MHEHLSLDNLEIVGVRGAKPWTPGHCLVGTNFAHRENEVQYQSSLPNAKVGFNTDTEFPLTGPVPSSCTEGAGF